MIAFPAALAPPAPFPLVVSQAHAPEFVAPGIRRDEYRLMTSDGPLVIHVVAVDPNEPTVRLGAVVAHDRMISAGETVSSMARRTHAVAGINADYFDITNTNQPLNVVVRGGVLERTPSKRVALTVAAGGSVAMGPVSFAGTATYGATQLPLTTVNEWPPQGGAGLLTPAYGALAAAPGVVVAHLEPLDTIAGTPGTYRVDDVGPAQPGPVIGTTLGFGPAALARAAPPAPGDTVRLAFDTTPPAGTLTAAVGGGPLLVSGGVAVADPNSPAPEETNVRFPVAGAAREPDGTVLFIVVDGRRAAVSIGLTRPQFAALMLAFGAVDGMAFDSGGSATLVARVLGDAEPAVLNDPSDGIERPVADGLFAYSDAPAGLHPHLIVRPASFVTVPNASGADPAVAMTRFAGAIVDDAGGLVRRATTLPVALDPLAGEHEIIVHDETGTYAARVSYRVVERIARLAIVPAPADPPPGGDVTLDLRAWDAAGDQIRLGSAATAWTIDGVASSHPPALRIAGVRHDFSASASLDGATSTIVVRVGSHPVAIAQPELALPYDLGGNARAQYANVAIDLPGEPLSFGIEAFGDGSGVPLRAAFVNRYGEKHALTLARHVDWTGWQRLTIALPPDLNPPIRLTAIYVVPSLGGPPVRAAGMLRFRSLFVIVPGMSP